MSVEKKDRLVKEFVRKYFEDPRSRRRPPPRPAREVYFKSAKKCPRQNWLDKNGPKANCVRTR